MHILVTGGAGFIGTHLVERLAAERTGRIVVLDNLRRSTRERLDRLSREIAFVQSDIRDYHALHEAMRGIDLVFHLAAHSNVIGAEQDTEYCFQANVAGTFHVLEAARRSGVKRVVFTSSREVYGDPVELPVPETAPLQPKNAYGVSKAAAELYCRLFSEGGLDVAVLRLANVYGPRDRDRVIPIFMENAVRGRPLVLYGGSQILDLVWIDTVIGALLKAGFNESIGGPVNVGSGRGTSIRDLAQRILEVTQSSSPIEVLPARTVEVTQFVADLDRARRVFGIEPSPDPLSHLNEIANIPIHQ